VKELEKFITPHLLSEMKVTREEGRAWAGSETAIALYATWLNMKNSGDNGNKYLFLWEIDFVYLLLFYVI
jgi:hypothetical protein